MEDIIKHLNKMIEEELKEWQKMGIPDPANSGIITPNTFMESVKLRMLLELLIAKDVVTEEELDRAYKKAMLDSLKEARENVKELRRQAIAVPRMEIPKGKINGR
jgi:hypothetical protein